ncbi:MAG: MFS transporter, partial [Candidatus Heimdallarchaeota archaeon]
HTLMGGTINIIGPAIGALLYILFDARMDIILWIDCITLIVALVPLLLISIPKIEKQPSAAGASGVTIFIQEFRDGFSILRSREGLISLLILITIINLMQIPIAVLGPLFVADFHNGSVQDLAFVVAASQLGLLVSGIFLLIKNGWKRKIPVIIVALYIQIFGYLIQAITPIGEFWFMAVGAFVFGSMLSIINSLYKTIIQVVVPPELQGRVNAITAALTGAILPIGVLATAPLAEIIGIVPLFLVTITISFITITLIWTLTDIRILDRFKDYTVDKEILPVENIAGVSN